MRNRLILAILILLCAYVYLALRLFPGAGVSEWLVLATLFALVLSIPFTRNSKSLLLRWLVYFDMGLLSFVFSFTILRDLISIPFLWFKPEWLETIFSPSASFVLIALAIFSIGFGMHSALRGPRIKNVRVPISGLPNALAGYKIAQISDLHLGPVIGRRYVDQIVRKIHPLQPDLTVLTGDIGDSDVEEQNEAVEALRALHPQGRKLFVTGNHEYYWNAAEWIGAFENVGIQALLNAHTIITHRGARLLIAGIIDPAVKMFHPEMKPDAKAALGNADGQIGIKILLAHNPSIAREAAALGFDLQLSGHTHGGQFFPWTLVVRGVHEFSRGLKACGRMWVYVNPGTGSWGPPIRLGSQTEITLIELVIA